MKKINQNAFALAIGTFFAIFLVIAFAFIIFFPKISLGIITRFLTINLETLTDFLTWGNIILTILSGFIFGYLSALLFATLYNGFNKFDEAIEHYQAENNKS